MTRTSRQRGGRNRDADIPSNFRRSWETGAKLIEELRAGRSVDEAISARRAELAELLAPSDAVHVLGHVIMSETFRDADTYAESEHPGLAYVIELVTAELARRPDRRGSADQSSAMDANFTERVRELTQQASLLETFRRSANAGGAASPETAARGRAAGQHLMMRAPGWPWQEHAVLRGLFGPAHISTRLVDALGFDAEQAIACSEAIADSVEPCLAAHMQRAREREGEFRSGGEAFEWATASLGGWQQAPGSQEFKATVMTALWAMNHIGEALIVDADSLSALTGLPRSVTEAFLRCFSMAFGQDDEGWFGVAEQVRYRPFLDLGNGQYLPTVPGNELWAMRPAFESALKGYKPYVKHRGLWLEETATQMLAGALAPDETHTSLKFSHTRAGGAPTEGELDGLLRLGDTALIVEAKSASLRPGARRGGAALISQLKENLTKAATQGDNGREALRRGDSFFKDGRGVELEERIREVHPVVVTLDDFSSVAPVIWQFAGTTVMPRGVGIPWIVTLYELELVCSTIEWPAQFVHFLRRRSRLNQRGELVASDELDWWMHYLMKGLYFEEDAGPIRLASHTDPLDAWVLHERGIRQAEAPKPATKVDGNTRQMLDLLHEERPGGWVAAACDILDPATKPRKEIWKNVQKLRRRARERQKVQRYTYLFDGELDPMMICSVVVATEDGQHIGEHLERAVAERVEDFGLRRVLGIGHVVSSRRPYDALLVVERSWQTDDD